MKVETLAVGAFQENTYLLVDDSKGESVLIDPGAEPDRLIAAVEKSGSALKAMWITHAHIDHVGGIAGVKRKWAVPVYLHPLDATLYRHAHTQAELYGLPFLLLYELYRGALKKNYKWCEESWVLETNGPLNAMMPYWDAYVYKKYRIYEKALA